MSAEGTTLEAYADVVVLGLPLRMRARLHEGMVFSVEFGDRTFGDLLRWLVRLARPGLVLELDPPWNALDQVHLKNLTLLLDTEGRIGFEYAGAALDLVFVRVTRLAVWYRTGAAGASESSVDVELYGTFFGKDFTEKPLSWDVLTQRPPEVPGPAPKTLDVDYLGLGQHVTLRDGDRQALTTLSSAIQALMRSHGKVDRAHAGDPLAALPALRYDAASSWLVGMQLSVLDTVTLGVLFDDPALYGLHLELRGERAKKLAGLSFDLLYRKIADGLGVFHVDLTVPSAMRQLELGAASLTLPVVVVDVFTNGNFKVDLGFPHGLDFSRSFALQFFLGPVPVLGAGGFYFGVLDSQTSTDVPRITNGRFAPVVVFGLGLQLGIGKTFDKGILRAGITLTVEGALEGVLGFFQPDDPALPHDTYYRVAGVVAVVGHVYGRVDFGILAAAVDLWARPAAQVVLEAHGTASVTLEASVSAKVSARIVFVKVSFSFSTTIRESVQLGSPSRAPWIVAAGAPAPALPGSRAADAPRAAAPGRRQWDVVARAAARPTVDLYVHPIVTAGLEGDGPGRPAGTVVPQLCASLFIRTQRGSLQPDPAGPAAAFLDDVARLLLAWAVRSRATDEAGEVRRADLEAIYGDLVTRGPERASSLDVGKVVDFLREHLQFVIRAFPDDAAWREAQAKEPDAWTVFPMLPFLSLATSDGQHTADFSRRSPCSASYRAAVAAYHDRLDVGARAPEGDGASSDDAAPRSGEPAAPSMASFLLGDYVAIVLRHVVQAALDLSDRYSHWAGSGETLPELAARFCPGQGDAEARILRANATSRTFLKPGTPLVVASRHTLVARGDTLARLGARLGLSRSDLAATVKDDTNLLAPGAVVRVPAAEYRLRWEDAPPQLAERFHTSVDALVGANPDFVWEMPGDPSRLPAGKAIRRPAFDYRVQPGDSLEAIVEAFGTSIDDLLSANEDAEELLAAQSPILARRGVCVGLTAHVQAGESLRALAGRMQIADAAALAMALGDQEGILPTGAVFKRRYGHYLIRWDDTLEGIVARFGLGGRDAFLGPPPDGFDWTPPPGSGQTLPVGRSASLRDPVRRIQPGDTLRRLADHFGVSLRSFVGTPGLLDDPHLLAPGRARLPPGLHVIEARSGTRPLGHRRTHGPPPPPSETLLEIAQRFGLTAQELGSCNPAADFDEVVIPECELLPLDELESRLREAGAFGAPAAVAARTLMSGLRLPEPDPQGLPPTGEGGDPTRVALHPLYALSGQQWKAPGPAVHGYGFTLTLGDGGPGVARRPDITFEGPYPNHHLTIPLASDELSRLHGLAGLIRDAGRSRTSPLAAPLAATPLPPYAQLPMRFGLGKPIVWQTPEIIRFTGPAGPDDAQRGSADVVPPAQPPSPRHPDATVAVEPAAATVTAGGGALQLAARIEGSTAGVSWSVQEGAAGGSVSASGLYTPPGLPGVYHVVAASAVDASRTAVSTVTVTRPAAVQIYALPDPLRRQLRVDEALARTPDPSPHLRLLAVDADPAPAGGAAPAATPIASSGWATRVDVTLRRVADPERPGRWLPFVYEVFSADEDGRGLLLGLLRCLWSSPPAAGGAELHLQYAPDERAGDALGLRSDALDRARVRLVRANLTTETRAPWAPAVARDVEAGGPPEPPTVATLDPADAVSFLELLWEAGVTNAGGYYLHYRTPDPRASGLPDGLFDEAGSGRLSVLAIVRSPRSAGTIPIRAFHNCVVIAETLDATRTSLFVEPPVVTVDAAEGTSTFADIAAKVGVDVATVVDANATRRHLIPTGPREARVRIRDHEVQVGDTLLTIAQALGVGVGDLTPDVSRLPLRAGATAWWSAAWMTRRATVAPGHAGFRILRRDPEALPEGPSRDLEQLFNVVGFALEAAGGFRASTEGLPATPTTPEQVGEEAAPPWEYLRVLPVARWASPAAGAEAAASPPEGDPYAGLGTEAVIRFHAQDILGNRCPLAGRDTVATPIRYGDPLRGPDQWPGVRLGYDLAPGPRLLLRFAADLRRHLGAPGGPFEACAARARVDLDAHVLVGHQLGRKEVAFGWRTSFGGDGALDAAPLTGFLASVRAWLATVTAMRDRVHDPAPGETLSGIAERFQVGVPELVAANGGRRILRAGAGVRVPHHVVVEREDSLESLVARARAALSARDVAGLERLARLDGGDVGVEGLAERNREVPLEPGVTLKVSERSYAAKEGDTLAAIATAHGIEVARLARENATVRGAFAQGRRLLAGIETWSPGPDDTLGQIALATGCALPDLAVHNAAYAPGAALLVPLHVELPPGGGEAGATRRVAAGDTLRSVADAAELPIAALALANRDLCALLAPGTLTCGGHEEAVGPDDTLGTLLARLRRRPGGAELTISDLAAANGGAGPTLRADALVVLPPRPVEVSVPLAPCHPPDVPAFPLAVELTIRRTDHVEPALAAAPGVASTSAALRPMIEALDGSGDRPLDLRAFAAHVAVALRGLRLATGDAARGGTGACGAPGAEERREASVGPTLMAVRLDDATVRYRIEQPPVFFAPPPLSRTSWSSAPNRPDATGRAWAGVDLDAWGRRFLEDMDRLLSAAFAPAIAALERERAPASPARPPPYATLLEAKRQLAKAISGSVCELLDRGPDDVEPDAEQRAAAVETLHQRLLARLSRAYTTDVLVQYRVSVKSPWTDPATAPRLSGSLVAELGADGAPPAERPRGFTIAGAKVRLVQDGAAGPRSWLTFAYDAAAHAPSGGAPGQELRFDVTDLEFAIEDVRHGYEASRWLALVEPVRHSLGRVEIPIPLRTHPVSPSMLGHGVRPAGAARSPPAADVAPGGDPVASLRAYHYWFSFAYQSAAQDRLEQWVDMNVPAAAAPEVDERDLPPALAAYVAEADGLSASLAALPGLVTAEADDATVAALRDALDRMAGHATRIARAWRDWTGPRGGAGEPPARDLPPRPARRGGSAERDVPAARAEPRLSQVVRLRSARRAGAATRGALPAGEQADAVEGARPPEAGDDAVYTYEHPLDVLRVQSASGCMRVTRNAELIRGRRTNERFVYVVERRTPQRAVPCLERTECVDLASLTGRGLPLVDHLVRFFGWLLDVTPGRASSEVRRLGVAVAYGMPLAASPSEPAAGSPCADPDALRSLLPVALVPVLELDPEKDLGRERGLCRALADAMTEWLARHAPDRTGAAWTFQISLHPTIPELSAHGPPLLTLRDVRLALRDVVADA